MNDHWQAFVKKDFSKATDYIYSADLEAAKIELLPVFLEASKSSETADKEMAAAFFTNVPEEKREALSPKQVFECLNQFIAKSAPDVFEVLKDVSPIIDKVQISGDEATVYYHFSIQDISESDTEALVKKNDRWWLRVKEPPKETAKKFRRVMKK